MVRLLFLFFFLLTVFLRLLAWIRRAAAIREATARDPRPPADATVQTLVKDPICGTFVPRAQALSTEAGGEVHFFCSSACYRRFRFEAESGEARSA